MPSLINRLPGGLLSLLGIKSVGENPRTLLDTVQPTIELTRFYDAYAAEALSGNLGSANALGVFYASEWWNLTGNEVWAAQSVCVTRAGYVALPAGTTYRARIAVFNPSNGVIVQGADASASFTAGETPLWTFSPNGVVLIPPGFACGLFVEAIALGTAQAFTMTGRLIKLQV